VGDIHHFGRGRCELADESFLVRGYHDLLKSPLLGGLNDGPRHGATVPRIQVFERFVELQRCGASDGGHDEEPGYEEGDNSLSAAKISQLEVVAADLEAERTIMVELEPL